MKAWLEFVGGHSPIGAAPSAVAAASGGEGTVSAARIAQWLPLCQDFAHMSTSGDIVPKLFLYKGAACPSQNSLSQSQL